MTSERFAEIEQRAKMFNEAVKFYGVHELIDRVKELESEVLVATEALGHIASKKPVCAGCTLADISLVEHYTSVAKQAMESMHEHF